MLHFDGAIKRKHISWQNYTAEPVTFIYCCRHNDHRKYKIIITFIFHNDFKYIDYQYHFHFSIGSSKLNISIKLRKTLRGSVCVRVCVCVCVCVCGGGGGGGGGRGVDNGNGNWCMLGRAFLCRTWYFCVEPCIYVSHWAFVCPTGLFVLNKFVINI